MSAPMFTLLMCLAAAIATAQSGDGGECNVGDVDLSTIPIFSIGTSMVWPTQADVSPAAHVVVFNVSLCSPLVVPPENITYCSGVGVVPPSYVIAYNMTSLCVMAALDQLNDVSISPTNSVKGVVLTLCESRSGQGINASVLLQCGGSTVTPASVTAQLDNSTGGPTLVVSLESTALCAAPTPSPEHASSSGSHSGSGSGTPPEVPSTTAAPPTEAPLPPHEMMSTVSFWLLVVLVAGAYYVALLVSSLAVGESTNTLLLPLKLLRTLALSTYDCMCFAFGGKRPVGYAGLDFNDDEDDGDIPNRPGGGL